MVELKNSLIRVRCIECKEENFIDMKLIGTEKEQRTISFEYEYIYRGELKCINCIEKMRLLIIIYEYPVGNISYVNIENKGCVEMEDLTDNYIIK